MASKKCPKCGEDNPAEAVMCWACYTPLSGAAGGGGAAAATLGAKAPIGGGAVGSPVINREETQKKNIDPRLIGAGAFLLVAAVVGYFVMGSMSTTTDDTGTGGTDPTPASSSGMGSSSSSSSSSQPVAPPPPPPSNSGGAAPPAQPAPFSMVTPPNPEFATGTAGILITPDKSAQAAGLARFAKDQLSHNGKWTNIQIAVFTDRQTADAFTQYQSRRRGAPLTPTEYADLASKGVWTTTPAFLDSHGKSDRIYYPSRTPNGWWSGGR